jgi:hypothetical protein
MVVEEFSVDLNLEIKESETIQIAVNKMESPKSIKNELKCQTPNNAEFDKRESGNLRQQLADQSIIISEENEVKTNSAVKEKVKDIQYYRDLVSF